MGIRFTCPNGHKLNVKDHLAGKRGICPSCGTKFVIPSVADSQEPAIPQRNEHEHAPRSASAGAQTAPPSIVIAVAEPPAPLRSNANVIEPITSPAESVPLLPESLPEAEPAPQVVAESTDPAPAVSKYVAHRQRNRSKQTTIAILLLLVVIVLAAVLFWVLRSGVPSGPAELSLLERRNGSQSSSSLSYSPTHVRSLT
jgi:hypothetical protein